jgi:hypothetical protein
MEDCRVAQKVYVAYLKLLYNFPLLFYVKSNLTIYKYHKLQNSHLQSQSVP